MIDKFKIISNKLKYTLNKLKKLITNFMGTQLKTWDDKPIYPIVETSSSNNKSNNCVVNPQIYLRNLGIHRGLLGYSENTIEALEAAYVKGFCYLECDVQISNDDIIFLRHNNTSTYVEGCPLLSNVLLWAKKRKVVLELDCAGRNWNSHKFEILYNLIEEYGMQHSIVLVATENDLNKLLDANLCNIPVCVSQASASVNSIESISEDMKRFAYVMVSNPYQSITNTDIPKACHKRGFGCKAYTVDTQSVAENVFSYGVDTILCDANELWDI